MAGSTLPTTTDRRIQSTAIFDGVFSTSTVWAFHTWIPWLPATEKLTLPPSLRYGEFLPDVPAQGQLGTISSQARAPTELRNTLLPNAPRLKNAGRPEKNDPSPPARVEHWAGVGLTASPSSIRYSRCICAR